MDKFEQLSIIEKFNEILGVEDILKGEIEIKKEKTYKGMKPSNKVKTLIIPVDESFMEGNLMEIPFIAYFKTKEPLTTVEYIWHDSKGIERKVEVRGSKWGVPDEFCFDILTALFRLYVKQNQGVVYSYDENKWNMNKTIYFSLSELAREIGYKSCSTNTLNKIDIGLEMLNDTTIYNKSCGGFLDVKSKEYITGEMKESIGIVRNYRSYKYSKLKEGEKRANYREIRDKTSVVIDDFIYESLCNSYFKTFNYTQYAQLHMGIAKKIFMLLNKWRAKRKRVFLKWETLYQRIPLDNSKTEKYKKKRVRDASKELIEIGYIKEVHEQTIGVDFVFELGVDEELAIDVDIQGISSYNTIPDILNALNNIDLDTEQVQSILNNANIDKIRDLLMKTECLPNIKRKEQLLTLSSVHELA